MAAPDLSATLAQLDAAAAAAKVTPAAAANIRTWLTEPRYREYAAETARHVTEGKWKELDDAFWTVIPFGTGGRRGKMYPIGCNVINDRTIGESAQGLATYVLEQKLPAGSLSCAIAYDTRHNSRRFAELCASIMVANGFKVYFLEDYRSTPELSFLVRYKKCSCGIMVTASHNPPSDNAVKVYWSSGAQVIPPHDKAIVDRVMSTGEIKTTDFNAAVEAGQVIFCKDEVDQAFWTNVLTQRTPGPRNLKIIYSPLHGVGESAVVPVLQGDGFQDVEVYGPHREQSGDFPNVPGHVSNPENVEVFDAIISRAYASGGELILATDPDCDRMGCAAPVKKSLKGDLKQVPWATFTGNQLGVLLADYVCESRRKTGGLTKENFLVSTLVTTQMIRRIGDSYGVTTYNNLHVGFKWIAQQIDASGPDKFLFGTEESHGFLIGQYVRDKDGAAACMLMAELAAVCKEQKKTVHEKLDSLYWQHGYHGERVLNVTMPGSAGMAKMQSLMGNFRSAPPTALGGIKVAAVRDYKALTRTVTGGQPEKLDAPPADMVILDLAEEGNYVAVRPSGTEPKVKFYMFTYTPAEQLADLDRTKEEMAARMQAFEVDLKAFAAKA
ncbi:Phosphoglucomutase [Anatilimnocola aggregata]|uniref:Phosphoglucomutase n=1 Tax=Anatilimnocola aggregata TaxID=2528021 RepID=A0A517YG83_9BACT|nr:phospho-sugar mutase [Anatilimnocola aggregata]QDU29211.1 Phosphoglucomutase [Anatilimnocola aggregata]